jgi:uncharacterized protein
MSQYTIVGGNRPPIDTAGLTGVSSVYRSGSTVQFLEVLMRLRTPGRALALFLLAAVLVAACQLAAQVRYPPRPGPRDFILDEAGLIDSADQAQIRATCDKLLTEERVPIVVVTIKSLADYGAQGLSIDAYARSLFDAWGIGSQANNYGVLLLVSLGDRKARIELGESWAHTRDADAQMVMDGIIIPNFKAKKFSAGILQGVQALDTLARGMVVKIPRPWWHPLVFFGLIALGIGVAISLIRSGRKGWGWFLLALIVGLVVAILVGFLRSRGGGSFGGGSGGGGGATGSW